MLVLTKKSGQSVTIDQTIEVTVLSIKGDKILLGFKAPKHVSIHRDNMKKNIIKEPIGQTESARDGDLFKWGLL